MAAATMMMTAGMTYLGQRGTVTWRLAPCCGPGTRKATGFSLHEPDLLGSQVFDGNLPASQAVPASIGALAAGDCLSSLERFESGERATQRADLDEPEPGRHRPGRIGTVRRRGEEDRRPRCPRGCHLLLDPP